MKDTSRPAFPSMLLDNTPIIHGITHRDYLVAKIAAGDAGAEEGWGVEPPDPMIERRVRLYYRIADAILKLRDE